MSDKKKNPASNQDGVMPCTLSDLQIGDKVQIKHYHLYKYGSWQSPSFIDYKYLGVKDNQHHFENVKYQHERFRMQSEYQDRHVFLGRYKA